MSVFIDTDRVGECGCNLLFIRGKCRFTPCKQTFKKAKALAVNRYLWFFFRSMPPAPLLESVIREVIFFRVECSFEERRVS